MTKLLRFLGFNYFIVPSSARKIIHIDGFMDGRCNVKAATKRIHYFAAFVLVQYRGYKLCRVCVNNSYDHV